MGHRNEPQTFDGPQTFGAGQAGRLSGDGRAGVGADRRALLQPGHPAGSRHANPRKQPGDGHAESADFGKQHPDSAEHRRRDNGTRHGERARLLIRRRPAADCFARSLKATALKAADNIFVERLVLPVRIELTTSPLPRECSTTELRQRFAGLLGRRRTYTRLRRLTRRAAPFRFPSRPGKSWLKRAAGSRRG